jgi:hypothetical protein
MIIEYGGDSKWPNVCLTGWLQPVLNKERLRIASPVFKLLLCRCDEAGDASRLSNNEIKPLKQIGLNSVAKNRTLHNPSQPNLMEQRRAGRWCRCLTWAANTTEENSAIAGIQTELQSAAKMLLLTTHWFG